MLFLDYDRVITHYIQQYKYEEALQMLSDQAKKVLDNKDKVRNYLNMLLITCLMHFLMRFLIHSSCIFDAFLMPFPNTFLTQF